MAFLKPYVRRYLALFLLCILVLAVEAGCDLLQPTVMSRIVDVGIREKNINIVLQIGGLMLVITAVGAVAAVVRNNISSRVSQSFGTRLRSDLFQKIQSLSLENIDRLGAPSLITRLTNDVTQLQQFFNGLMRVFVKAPLLCIGSIIMATLLNPGMSIVLVCVVPVVVLLIWLNIRLGYPRFRRVQAAIDRINGVTREYLSGVRVVKAFNRSGYEEERFSDSNEHLADMQASAMRVMAVFSPGVTLTVNLGIIAVLWFGGIRVNVGKMEVGQIIAFVNYMMQISTSLMTISMVFNMFVRARASAERIGEVCDTVPTLSEPEHPVQPDAKGSVEFKNLSFSYTGDLKEPALKDVSLIIRPGETVGIIGPTGSGKTTLVSLIPRFYDATAGEILLAGTDVRRINSGDLRRSIAVVPQKNTLFTGTVLENIRWGDENATLEQVRRAAAAAQADGFIAALPEGYDTIVGQSGVNLSGGQKQRVSIARALVRRPDILILDDCTSAVDAITEAKLRSGLRAFSDGMTCIIIAQRIATVMNTDKILVLDDGRAVGLGTHSELLESCEVYRSVYESQYGRGRV